MKKKNQRSKMLKQLEALLSKKQNTSRIVAMTAAVTMVLQTVFPALAMAANEIPAFPQFQLEAEIPVITYNEGDDSFDVSIDGGAESSLGGSNWRGHYVRFTWDDGIVRHSNSAPYQTEVTDTIIPGPPFGNGLVGGFSGDHNFTAPGTYDITIEWYYNPNQSNNPFAPLLAPAFSNLDNDQIRARITVPVTLEVPEEPLPGELTSDDVTICSEDDGYKATISGSGSMSPFTWSSLGYYIRTTWGDDETTYSDTPDSGATDTFNTPDRGRSLEGDWTAEHTYSDEGTYDVTVDLFYNPNQPHTNPVKVPGNSDLSNDELKATLSLQVNTEDVSPCNPPDEEEEEEEEEQEPELPLDIDGDVVDICTDGETYQVSLEGNGGGSPFTWSSLAYYVHLDWDDDTTSNSDTPGSDASDSFRTPDRGRSLTGEWNADHEYSTAGIYEVTVQLYYNPNQPHTNPVKVPAASNLDNDILKAQTTIEVDLTGEIPDCNPQDEGSAQLTITKVWEAVGETPSEATATFDGGVFLLNAENNWQETFTRTPGIYGLFETEIEGYESSIQCSVYFDENSGEVSLTDGDSATCTITNTEILGEGTVTIEKVWSFADASSTSYPDFSITLDGNDVGITSTTSVSDIITVTEGTHTITETVTGFDVGVTCFVGNATSTPITVTNGEFLLDEDQNISCVVTNTEQVQQNPPGGGGGGGTITVSNGPGGSIAPSGAGNLTANNSVGDAEPRVLGVQDTDEAILTCAEQYPEAALITGDLDDLLAAYGFTRNTGLEGTYGGTLVPKILVPGAPLGSEQILQNFIVYGIQSLLELGAGERAGIVATFVNLYGVLPENECDWQNVIRIGQGVVPVVKSSERELFIEGEFEKIYDRAPDRAVPQDNVTVLIMTYGLRPDVRSLQAEIQAANIFKGEYGHFPENTSEWDIMRGIAYGGLTVPGHSPIVR